MNSNIINVILIKKCFQKRDSYERCDKYIVWYKKFTYAWEQRKFEDVGTVAMCKRIFKEQTSEERSEEHTSELQSQR